ncbi:MAG TPA: O-antigen ligase family protein [Pirellulales bacterium]|jgi:O-antigen ligase|nr:O-antigen ligase family protein [Pirellulales bacterium]
MNFTSSLPYDPRAVIAQIQRRHEKGRATFDTLTLNGILLFFIGLTVVGSGFRAARPEIGGLLLQPYLVPILLAMPYILLSRLQELPTRVLLGLGLFTLSFVMTSLGPASLAIMLKLVVSVLTTATIALLVRSRADLIAGATGLLLAVAALALHGLEEPDLAGLGVKAIEVANKNSYSMYALPALLLAGYLVLRIKPKSKVLLTLSVVCSLAVLVAIFMSGNRSGYLGAVLVALLLVRERKIAGVLLVGMVVAAIAYYLINHGSTEILERRVNQTVEGNSSDTLRINLLKACVKIGLANPIAGVSPGNLPDEIRHNMATGHVEEVIVGPHNVFGLIIGGNGLLCTGCLLLLAWSLWTWPPSARRGGSTSEFIEARKLLRYMLVLWAVRGMFNDEILYNPGFCIGLGLAMGMCVAASKLQPLAVVGAGARPQLAPTS